MIFFLKRKRKKILLFSCFQIIWKFECLIQWFFFVCFRAHSHLLPLSHKSCYTCALLSNIDWIYDHPKAVSFNSQSHRHEAGQECGTDLPGLLQTQQSGPGQRASSHPKVKHQMMNPILAFRTLDTHPFACWNEWKCFRDWTVCFSPPSVLSWSAAQATVMERSKAVMQQTGRGRGTRVSGTTRPMDRQIQTGHG